MSKRKTKNCKVLSESKKSSEAGLGKCDIKATCGWGYVDESTHIRKLLGTVNEVPAYTIVSLNTPSDCRTYEEGLHERKGMDGSSTKK